MQRLFQRARTLVQKYPLLGVVGAVVLLALAGSLIFRLLLLLALLVIPVGIGVMIGWQLRSDPGSVAPLVRWRDQFLDNLFAGLEIVLRWVERQLAHLRARKPADPQPLDSYQEPPQQHQ